MLSPLGTNPAPISALSNLYPGIIRLLANRTISNAVMAENIRKTVLELTEEYPFPLLEIFGPTVQLIPGQSFYDPSYFWTSTSATPVDINSIDSFFIYSDTTYTPSQTLNNTGLADASGYPLIYKDIKSLEILINQNTLPTNWTRYAGQIGIAATPDLAYYAYMRYREQHPFPNAGGALAGQDPLYLPYSWQDIIEIGAAQRCAVELRLYDMAAQLHNLLYGDPLFQRSGGTEGAPGLIFKRVSTKQQDLITSSVAMKLRINTYMR